MKLRRRCFAFDDHGGEMIQWDYCMQMHSYADARGEKFVGNVSV